MALVSNIEAWTLGEKVVEKQEVQVEFLNMERKRN
jgi:hypothetical protein